MNYQEVVDNFYVFLNSVDSEITKIKISEDKWSLIEIIGHLIDSASNNHQRFVRLQFSDLLDFPVYEAEQWIKIQNYNSMDWKVLVALWYNYNCLLINIIAGIKSDKLKNMWVITEEQNKTLEELIQHYFNHMEQHVQHFNNRLGELLL